MQRSLILSLIVLLFTGSTLNGQCQSSHPIEGDKRGQTESPPPVFVSKAGIFRPTLSMQAAFKIAEAFIEHQHIDIAPYWLYRSVYMGLGDEKTPPEKRLYGWHFMWVNEKPALGDDIEIFVDLEGRVSRMPTM